MSTATSADGGRLLFVSNLFPDQTQPYRGLDNATILHHLADRWQIRVLALRPSLPWQRHAFQPRPIDEPFAPEYARVPYVPKIGSRVNHLLVASALRFRLQALRKTAPFDVVLSSWIYPDSCGIAKLSQELAFPFVAIAQGSDVHSYLQIPARRRAIQKWMPQAAGIITRSADLARRLREAGLAAERLHPIYNGVDRTVFQPAHPRPAAAAKVILFVGNFYSVKQPLVLISAFADLVSRSSDAWELHLVGGGPLEPQMRSLIEQRGIHSRVRFLGRMDAQGVAACMQSADILCLPSANEGVPNVILEAFACGIPVVASDVGGISEVLTSNALGRLVPSGDTAALANALEEMVSGPGTREEILRHSERFTWDQTADAYHRHLVTARHHSR